jgi:hypothetical protein
VAPQVHCEGAQRLQLSADLLVISKFAVAKPSLPKIQGRDLFAGAILDASDFLRPPSASPILRQQMSGEVRAPSQA